MNLKATPYSGAHTRLRQIKKLSLPLPLPPTETNPHSHFQNEAKGKILWNEFYSPLCPSQELTIALTHTGITSFRYSAGGGGGRGIGRVASAGRVKVFIWRTDGPAKRVTLPSKRLANFLFLL